MTKNNTNPKRAAAIAMLKAGTGTLSEVAALAGVSRQAASRWIEVEHAGKRTLRFDWQEKRQAYLDKQWRRQFAKYAKNSAVGALRE